jgi:hypothetical protein
MKKILLVLIILMPAFFITNAMDGDGSSSNPFRGTLNTAEVWSIGEFTGNTVYIGTSSTPDLTIITNGHLTIEPGITVVFTQATSDLKITETGILTADGTSSDHILFTKAAAISHWGHITFETPGSSTPISGTGTFSYCTVEYGYAITSGTNPDNMGGAIQVNASNVTIQNCHFNNNTSAYGGAIAINLNMNTQINSCYFVSNNVTTGGGAILLRAGSTAVVENSIFHQNNCSGSYSGGAIWLNRNTSAILNCTFVQNTSDYAGDAVYSLACSGARIINSIFWGSNDQFAGANTFPTISYCAFETSRPSSATNSIIINSSNTATDGPNFLNPSGSDWRIAFVSPCRDAGTNSFTGVTIPTTDYSGNSRISTKDMGCYEVQYSLWTGTTSTSWSTSSNWVSNIDPASGSGDVIIPSGLSTYPTSSSNPDFTIGSGKQMILNPGARATLGALTNSGTLRLESSSGGTSSLIVSSFSGNNASIQIYLTGGGSKSTYRWHYISTPVSSLPVSTFTTVTPDIVRFYDSRVTTDLVQGWVAQDGWIYSTGTFGGPTFTTLTPGRGYDFFDSSNNTFTFTGQLNTSDVQMTLEHAGGSKNGFNLLGNPFSSGLDWDYIISNNYPANTSRSLFFTRDNALCTYIGGVGSPSDVTGIIPPMQGFFVKTYSSGNVIPLAAAARTQSNIHARYKGSAVIPLIRLSVQDDTLSDETVVRFDEKASETLDNDFDALKIFYSTENTALYSYNSDLKYVINGQPFPDTSVYIPLGINLLASGNHTISVTQLQGLDSYGIYLIDNVSGYTADLKTNPVVTFNSDAGSIPGRYILKISNFTTGIIDHPVSKSVFNIYENNGFINIKPLAADWNNLVGSVTVIDMNGRKVTDLKNSEFVSGSVISIPSPGVAGIYFVELKSGLKRYIGKVIIK